MWFWVSVSLLACLVLSVLCNLRQAEHCDRQELEIERLKRVVLLLREHTSFRHGDVVAMSWRRKEPGND